MGYVAVFAQASTITFIWINKLFLNGELERIVVSYQNSIVDQMRSFAGSEGDLLVALVSVPAYVWQQRLCQADLPRELKQLDFINAFYFWFIQREFIETMYYLAENELVPINTIDLYWSGLSKCVDHPTMAKLLSYVSFTKLLTEAYQNYKRTHGQNLLYEKFIFCKADSRHLNGFCTFITEECNSEKSSLLIYVLRRVVEVPHYRYLFSEYLSDATVSNIVSKLRPGAIHSHLLAAPQAIAAAEIELLLKRACDIASINADVVMRQAAPSR